MSIYQCLFLRNVESLKNSLISINICFLELLEEFPRDSKKVRISYGKRAIDGRAIVVLLCLCK